MGLTENLDPALVGDVPIPGPIEVSVNPGAGQWPRMLNLAADVEDRLVQFLDHEISQAWAEREILVQDWIQWHKDYWAKPASAEKNFPFRKAANVVIPITAIAVEAILARLLTTIFSVKPFYSIRPRTKEWIEHAPAIEAWLQTEIEDPLALNAERFAEETLLELIKLGTGVGKSGYERDIRKVNTDLPDGSSVARWVERRNGATLDYVPLANFLMRIYERDPQTAVWCGEEHHDITWTQLKRNALSGRMRPEAIEKIKHWWGGQGEGSTHDTLDEARRTNEGDEPAWNDTFNFAEVWISFDVDKDGVDEEIVVEFHKPSLTILSVRYNWYEDLHRPYRVGNFIPVEGRWAGIGTGKQLEQFQALITTVHRQRLDAGTLANMGQLALKRNSPYGENEPIQPGKIWFFDNPATDIKEFSLSNTQHFAQIQNESAAQQYADKRSGVNELVLGIPHQGTPGTATSDLAKLAEGNKKFDMVLKGVRRWFGLLGGDILANYQQFGSRGRSWTVQGEEGDFIEHYLTLPQESVRRGAHIELTVTDSITNRDVEQQKWSTLFALLSQHYDKALERSAMVAQIAGDPTIFLAFADIALRASNTAMRRMLESFQVVDVDAFLLDIDKALQQVDRNESGATEAGESGAGRDSAGVSGSTRLPPFSGTPEAAGGLPFTGNGVRIE